MLLKNSSAEGLWVCECETNSARGVRLQSLVGCRHYKVLTLQIFVRAMFIQLGDHLVCVCLFADYNAHCAMW